MYWLLLTCHLLECLGHFSLWMLTSVNYLKMSKYLSKNKFKYYIFKAKMNHIYVYLQMCICTYQYTLCVNIIIYVFLLLAIIISHLSPPKTPYLICMGNLSSGSSNQPLILSAFTRCKCKGFWDSTGTHFPLSSQLASKPLDCIWKCWTKCFQSGESTVLILRGTH